MTEGYKLCPKCNNALDNNVMQCPYCGENLGIGFGVSNNNSGFDKSKSSSKETKKSGGCGCGCFFLFLFIIFTIILGVISSLFDEFVGQESSELRETATQELGNTMGMEDDFDEQLSDSEEIVKEENVQKLLNPDELKAINEFDEIFEVIGTFDYPRYKDEEGWDVELSTSSFGSVNNFKKNIVLLKYRGSEYKRYFLQFDQGNLEFFFDDENNNTHKVTENEVLDSILPIFEKSLESVE